MERSITLTKDGSHTITIPALNVNYHSHHGAIQESMHVYINAGLQPLLNRQIPSIEILEIGFGTGLNALLSFIEAENRHQKIHYSSIELYPLHENEIALLNYCEQLNRPDLETVFQTMHQCAWDKDIPLSPFFTLTKLQANLLNLPAIHPVHLVYFDAFAPTAQPELWSSEIFEKIIKTLLAGGILVTYCSKSNVRRAMRAAGFTVEKLQGPRGKREMVRAIRPADL